MAPPSAIPRVEKVRRWYSALGNLAPNVDVKITYRVFVGPGSGVGDAINKGFGL